MKISGFTVVRNATLMGYPIKESLLSLLPLCDEIVVGVGQSDDDTKSIVSSLASQKIRIIDTFWDTNKTNGGLVLSEKTNEALAHCQNDWCVYLQADEVLHQDDIGRIHNAIGRCQNDLRVEGLLFDYIHFYGSYSVVATARNWYRREVRAVRKSSGIKSWQDAQGFRVRGEKPHVKLADARVFHYGWVKPPQLMGQKNKLLSRWWHGNRLDHSFDQFQYEKQYGLKRFEGEHPLVMNALVKNQDWDFDHKKPLMSYGLKDLNFWLSDGLEALTGHRIGEYRNYRLL